MALFVKQGSTWKKLTNFFVKQGDVWKSVKYAYVKVGSVWQLFYPKSGPFTTTSPYISTDAAGNVTPSGFTLDTGSTVYLQKGTWSGNGYTISSYNYTFGTNSNPTPATGGTTNQDSGSLINYAQETLTASIYDGLYVVGNIVANTTTSGITGSDSTDSNGYRYFVCRKYPPTQAAGYSPYITSNPTSTETVVSSGDLIVRGASSFTYQNFWNGTLNYLPDSTRSSVIWYSSTDGSYTSAAQIVANATYVSSPTPTITSNGTLYTVSSTFTPSSIAQGTYYYAVDYEYNSNTDFNINPSTKYAVVGPINSSPTPTIYPTLTAVTPSGYIGNQNSFTVGATVTGNTGSWNPTPNGTFPIISSFKYSSSSSISSSSQGNWNFVTSPTGQAGIQDTVGYQNHSFILGSLITSTVASAGKYLEYVVSAMNGNGANSSSDFYTNAQLIYPAPNAQTIVSMTWTASNAANVTWSSLYTSDHYQLTYSTSSTTSSGTWTPIDSFQYTSGSAIAYSGLPSGTYYYSVVSYNADGVGIYGPVFSYNSTPSPSTPTFTYDYGGNALYNGTITATATAATSMFATVYRSASSTWGTTTTYDTAASYGTNKLYYSIPSNGYYYIYVTATNAYGSTSAYSIYNNTTIFYAGIPIGTSAQSVSASTTALQINLSWTPANWQTFAPYTGDNITYTNNNSSYEVYRSTSSSTPATSVTPNYTGLTGSSYSDTTGLSASTRYYYWIRGRNNNTFGGWVSMSSALTYTPPNPQAFTTISGTKAYPTGATQGVGEPSQNRILSASWNASTNAYYYEVQYEGSNDNATWTILRSFASAPLITATSETYTAIYKRYYRYAVRATPSPYSITYAAYSDYGTSGSLQYYYMTGSAPTAPAIGTIVLGTGASYGTVTVNYSFPSDPGSNTINYNYWSTDNINFTAVYSTSFNIASLSASTTYTVYVKSLNYDNLYSGTSSKSFTTNAVLAPTNNTAPTLSPSSISVGTQLTAGVGTWNNSPSSYDLRIYRGTQFVSTSETLVASTTSTSLNYTVTQADYDSGARYFKVYASASNVGGSSGFVGGTEVGPIATPVSIPSGGSVTLSGSTTAGSIITASTSGWAGSPTSYDVYITTTTSGTPTSSSSRVSSSNGSSSTTYTITSSDAAPPVNIFRAFATASNSAGTSGTIQSSNVITTTQSGGGGGGTAPVAPAISGNNSLAVGGTFSWSSSGATGYAFSVYGPSGLQYSTYGSYVSTTSFRPGYDATWQGAGTYSIYVYAHNAYGDSTVASSSTYMN